jgi:hypothetical protein
MISPSPNSEVIQVVQDLQITLFNKYKNPNPISEAMFEEVMMAHGKDPSTTIMAGQRYHSISEEKTRMHVPMPGNLAHTNFQYFGDASDESIQIIFNGIEEKIYFPEMTTQSTVRDQRCDANIQKNVIKWNGSVYKFSIELMTHHDLGGTCSNKEKILETWTGSSNGTASDAFDAENYPDWCPMRAWAEPQPVTIMNTDQTQTVQRNRNLIAVEEPTGLALQNSRVLAEADEDVNVTPMTTDQKMLAAQYMCKAPKRPDQNKFSIEFEFDENDYFDQSWKAEFDFDMEEKVLPPDQVGADGEQLMLAQKGTVESYQLPLDACLKTWKTCTLIDASVYQIPWDKNILPGGSNCLVLSLQEQFRVQAKKLTRWACVKPKVADLQGEDQL